jgi:hypothetical protein
MEIIDKKKANPILISLFLSIESLFIFQNIAFRNTSDNHH